MLMLDIGRTLDAETEKRIARLRTLPHTRWRRRDLRPFGGVSESPGGIPLKRAFGSTYPYKDSPSLLPQKTHAVDAFPSVAQGGWSTIWGAAVLPYSARELSDWPVTLEELRPHYEAILRFVPLTGSSDALSETFPLYSDSSTPLTRAAPVERFLADIEQSHDVLKASGLLAAPSRLAVYGKDSKRGGCVYCARCLYGCPYDVIYSSAHTLETLRTHPGFTYKPSFLVERVQEDGESVVVNARSVSDGAEHTFSGSRVYLGAGTFATTRILLASQGMYDTPVTFADSQYFVFPFLRFRGSDHSLVDPMNTLAQAFLQIDHPSVGPHDVHLQVYPLSEMHVTGIPGHSLLSARGIAAALRPLTSRVLVVGGYLHSDDSPHIMGTLARTPTGDCMDLSADPTPDVRERITRLFVYLQKRRQALGGTPLPMFLRRAQAGRGYHSGGSFPMRKTPTGRLESDLLGRPQGYARVHAIDATVFPTIPANTITLTVMANAHRIAMATAQES